MGTGSQSQEVEDYKKWLRDKGRAVVEQYSSKLAVSKISPYPPFPESVENEAHLHFNVPEPTPFIDHAKLVRLAKKKPPIVVKPTVSAFTGWIYDLYVPERDEQSIERGAEFEVMFASLFKNRNKPLHARKLARVDGSRINANLAGQWDVEYEDPLDRPNELFSINSLSVCGSPMVGRPDMVYRQRGTGNVLIVEHKSYWKRDQIPSYGWPNLKVQLWCYGMIDRWRDAPKIFVMGRIFDLGQYMYDMRGFFWGYQNSNCSPFYRYIFNTDVLSAKDPRVHQECLELFTLYGGRYSDRR